MLLEIFGVILVIIAALAFAGAILRAYTLGWIASFLLFILAMWIIADGLQYRVGETTVTHFSGNNTIVGNDSITVEYKGQIESAVLTFDYQEWVWPYENSFIKFKIFMGIFLLLTSMFGLGKYSLDYLRPSG